MDRPRKTDYPMLQFETARSDLAGTLVYHTQQSFCDLFRVPLRDKYKKGVLFTASGDVVAYEGGAGQPRFTQTTGRFLDFLFLPGLVFFFAAYFVYYGPRPNGRSHPDLPEYKATLIKAARTKFKRSRTLGELERGVTRASNAQDVVLAYEHWQYFGGVRDEDGHPEESPEYSP